MLLNVKSALIVAKQLVFFFYPKKYKQPAPSNVFLNGVPARVQFSDPVKCLGVWINASLKDDDDIKTKRQTKSLYVQQTSSEAHSISALLQ